MSNCVSYISKKMNIDWCDEKGKESVPVIPYRYEALKCKTLCASMQSSVEF